MELNPESLPNCLSASELGSSYSSKSKLSGTSRSLVTPESKSWLETEITGQSRDGFACAQSLWALFFNLFIQFPIGVCNFNQ